jgi:hypothetical protein
MCLVSVTAHLLDTAGESSVLRAVWVVLLATDLLPRSGSAQPFPPERWLSPHSPGAELGSAARLAAEGKSALGCKEPPLPAPGAASSAAGAGAGLRAKLKRFLGAL